MRVEKPVVYRKSKARQAQAKPKPAPGTRRTGLGLKPFTLIPRIDR